MKTFRSLSRLAANALLATVLLAPGWVLADASLVSSLAAEIEGMGQPDTLLAQSGDCYSLGEHIAAQNAGTLARATVSTEGGRQTCRVVVLVPAKDGQRPRRSEIVVPLD